MRLLLLGSAILLASPLLLAQTQGPAQDIPAPPGLHLSTWHSVEFSMEPRAPGASPWTIRIYPDRTGAYHLKETGPQSSQAIAVSDATVAAISRAEPKVASGKCETKLKNIAHTGKKQMDFDLGPALSSCTFDYSDDDGLMQAVAAFEAIAETMQFGARLEHLHRYDRLGLDAEIDSLTSEAQAGRAIELQNIAPALQSIFEDERVMERVRRKAGRLLQQAGVSLPLDAGPPASSPR